MVLRFFLKIEPIQLKYVSIVMKICLRSEQIWQEQIQKGT